MKNRTRVLALGAAAAMATTALVGPAVSAQAEPGAMTLAMARRIARDAGVNYVYIGNAHDKGRQSTYCPNCATRTIGRDWYELSEWRVVPVGNDLALGGEDPKTGAARVNNWRSSMTTRANCCKPSRACSTS